MRGQNCTFAHGKSELRSFGTTNPAVLHEFKTAKHSPVETRSVAMSPPKKVRPQSYAECVKTSPEEGYRRIIRATVKQAEISADMPEITTSSPEISSKQTTVQQADKTIIKEAASQASSDYSSSSEDSSILSSSAELTFIKDGHHVPVPAKTNTTMTSKAYMAFELGVAAKVKVFIGSVAHARDPQLLRELGVKTLIRCVSYTGLSPRTRAVPAGCTEKRIRLIPASSWTSHIFKRTKLRLHSLALSSDDIMFWFCSGTQMSIIVAAMFALSMWPFQEPKPLLLAMNIEAGF